jgi:hypothetical protein
MNKGGPLDRNDKGPAGIKVALTATVAVWTAVVVILIAGVVWLLERPSQALQPIQGANIPQVILEPDTGASGTEVIVRGWGWTPGRPILVFLVAPGQSQPPSYATSSAIADAQGRFTAGFVVPSDPGWQSPGQATVIVRDSEDGASARAVFNVIRSPVQPPPTPTGRPEPTATATLVPTWTPSPTPTPTPPPRIPTAITTADLHVPTPTPTPIPTLTPPPQPLIITDWRGEYFANRELSGDPVLVRNDPAIKFDWGTGSPGSGVPADDFSARWTRSLYFKAGTYRFHIQVDDGVRLWIDGKRVIDSWHDGSSHLVQKKYHISEGRHHIKIEYYEHKGGALIDVKWKGT